MSFPEGPWLFVINPNSGNGVAGKLEPSIRQWIEANNIEAEIIKTTGVGNAREMVSKKFTDFSTVVAVFGDGTVSEVGSALVNSKCTLGILPCGSGNGLARQLNYPSNPIHALQQLSKASVLSMDTLEVNGKICLNVVGIGFDGYIAAEFGRSGKRGLSGYITTTIGALSRLKEFEYECEASEVRHNSKATIVVISNGSQYGNNAYLDPASDVGDGKFELIGISCNGVLDAAKLIYRSFRKKLMGSHLVKGMPNQKEVSLKLSAMQPYHIDGEPIGQEMNFSIRIKPQSLSVMHFPIQSPSR